MATLARWGLAGLAVAALVPLAANQWRELAASRVRDAQVRTHIAAARRAMVDGRPDHALVALGAARELDPLDPDVQRALCEANVRVLVDAPERLPRETAVAAAQAIQQALPLLRGAEAARYQVALGNLAALTGQDPRAWYEQALAADPASLAAHLYLGLSLLSSGEPEAAESHLRRAHEAYTDDLRVQRALGLVYGAQGKWTQAAELLATLARKAPDREVSAVLGRAWMEQRKYTVAAASLERALVGAPRAEAARLHALLGRARQNIQQFESAVEHFEAALAVNPAPRVRLALADARAAQGELGRAEREYAAVIAADPGIGEAYVGRIGALRAMGRHDEARGVAAGFGALLRAYPGLRAYEGAVTAAAQGK